MTRPTLILVSFSVMQLAVWNAANGEERFVQIGGETYRETETTERRPVASSRWVETEETVMRDRYVTEMRDNYRTVFTPVTEYRPEARWHNLWLPFARPYVAIHMRPTTYWEPRTQRYQTPVTYRETVPETRMVRRLERAAPHFVEERIVRRERVYPQIQSQPSAQIVRRPSTSSRLFDSQQLKDGPFPRTPSTMR